MDTKPTNPLVKHFRRPAIHFSLPSNGRYWDEGGIDLPVTGQIPVYPMTTSDEITLKTPDALMNGSGMVSVIQSCCPSITDAWKIPSVDVDAILIAIRIASYGQAMTIGAKCPKCGEEHDYDIDLSNLISQIKCPSYDRVVDYDGLKIKLRPQHYFSANRSNIINFEEQKIINTINDSNLSTEEKNERLGQSMKKLLDANIQILADSTEYIETEDGVKVREPEFIKEFYVNAESRVTKQVEALLADFAKEGALPLIKLSCDSCNNKYEVPLEFDYARFFAQGS